MNALQNKTIELAVRSNFYLEKARTAAVPLLLFGGGTILLLSALGAEAQAFCAGPSGSCSEADFDPDLISNAVGNLFQLIEGAFGALIMVVAGLGAIVAAAMGAYRAAVGMLVVAVGAFILRSLVSLFFGTDFMPYAVD